MNKHMAVKRGKEWFNIKASESIVKSVHKNTSQKLKQYSHGATSTTEGSTLSSQTDTGRSH